MARCFFYVFCMGASAQWAVDHVAMEGAAPKTDGTCGASLASLNSCYLRVAADGACTNMDTLNSSSFQAAIGCRHDEPLASCQQKCLEVVGGQSPGSVCSVTDQQMLLYSGSPNLVVAYETDAETGLLRPHLASADGAHTTYLGDMHRCMLQDSMQYCLVDAKFHVSPTFQLPGYLGICRPRECSTQEIDESIADVAKAGGFEDYYVSCRDKDHPVPVAEWSFGQVLAVTVVVLILGCVLAGTIVDTRKARPGAATNGQGTQAGTGPTCLGVFLNHFSLVRNYASWAKVVPEEPKAAFGALHGLRVLSAFWVILGHSVIWPLVSVQYENNDLILPPQGRMGKSIAFQVVPAGFFAVDTFFWIAGFLGARTIDAKFRKSPRLATLKGFLGLYPVALFGRWLRLTPIYAFVMLFSNTLFRTLGSNGLFWNSRFGCINSIESADCAQFSWANLLYVNNIVEKLPFGPVGQGSDHCMLWSWYLACDMQMFLLLPFICVAKARLGPVAGWAIISILGVVSVVYTAWVIQANQWISDPILGALGYFDGIYVQTLPRIQPYLIGIGAAWVHQGLVERNGARFDVAGATNFGVSLQPREGGAASANLPDESTLLQVAPSPYNKKRAPGYQVGTSVLLQLLSFVLMVSVTFGCLTRYQCDTFAECTSFENGPWPSWLNIAYGSLSHAVWALGLSLLFGLVFLKAPGTWWINWLLGSDWWQPFQKLTYAAYLIHPLVLVFVYCSLDGNVAYTDVMVVLNFLGFVVLSFAIALILWLCVEKPFANLAMWMLAKLGIAGSPGD